MKDNRQQAQNCDAWIQVFTRLGTDGPPSMDHLLRITCADVQFKDPFNDIVGQPALLALLQHTCRQIQGVSFEVLDKMSSGPRVYLKWTMTGRLRLLGLWQVQGMSELMFDAQGRLSIHRDYWDASEYFYARLPIIGSLLRWIRSQASAS